MFMRLILIYDWFAVHDAVMKSIHMKIGTAVSVVFRYIKSLMEATIKMNMEIK